MLLISNNKYKVENNGTHEGRASGPVEGNGETQADSISRRYVLNNFPNINVLYILLLVRTIRETCKRGCFPLCEG